MSFLFRQGIRTHECIVACPKALRVFLRHADTLKTSDTLALRREFGPSSEDNRAGERMQNACQAGDITDHDIYTLHVEEQRHTTCTVRIMYEVGIECNGMGCDVRVKANLIPSRLRFSHTTVSASCAAFRQRSSSSRRIVLPWMPSSRRRRTV